MANGLIQTPNLMSFVVSMASLAEQKKHRELEKEKLKIAKEQLGISSVYAGAAKTQAKVSERAMGLKEEQFAAEKPLRELAAELAKEKKARLAELKREYDKAKQYGTPEDAAKAKKTYETISKLNRESPITLDTVLFADEIYKVNQAQLAAARQQSFALADTIKNMELMNQYKDTMYREQLRALQKATTSGNVDLVSTAISGLLSGTPEGMKQFQDAIAQIPAREFELVDPGTMKKAEIEAFEPGSLAQVRQQYYYNQTWPEVRAVYVRPLLSANKWQLMTRKRAEELGYLEEWEKAEPNANVETVERLGRTESEKQKPKKSPKSAKEGAKEAVSKIEPAKKKKKVLAVRSDGTIGYIPVEDINKARLSGFTVLEKP